ISEEAARVYRGHGISWEAGFLEGSAQRMLVELLGPHMRVVDLMPAFIDLQQREKSRRENGVGEYFVYDRGDKLDWNHPNRAGHRRIAEYLTRIELFGPAVAQPVSAAAAEPARAR